MTMRCHCIHSGEWIFDSLVSAFDHSFAIDVSINFIACNLPNVSMTIDLFISLFRLEGAPHRKCVRMRSTWRNEMEFIADWIKSNNETLNKHLAIINTRSARMTVPAKWRGGLRDECVCGEVTMQIKYPKISICFYWFNSILSIS